jgi:TetR/AcrR family transcriptional regulator, transcriptional repressor for nem operon
MMTIILSKFPTVRYDADHKQKTREKVLKAAAKAIRAHGPHRVGVADVMRDAGLTHGGFYAHFESKDDLVAAAIGQMFEQSRARFVSEVKDYPPARALNAYVDFYLSQRHRDARASGCPIPALAGDLPRLDRAARTRFAEGVAALTHAVAERIEQLGHCDEPEALARSVVAEMVGALSLARAEPEEEKSNQMLADSRELVKKRLGIADAGKGTSS